MKKTGKQETYDKGFKGELVDNLDTHDFKPTGRNVKNNPFKTPPNNLTTKEKR